MPRSGYDVSGFGRWAVSPRPETDPETAKRRRGGSAAAGAGAASGEWCY
ncbi:hypothetical protein VTH06DRAFT_5486 [Thermothelomyces fergusii]